MKHPRPVAAVVRSLGGVAATYELRGRGLGRDDLYRAEVEGSVLRPRKGWYVTPDVGFEVIRAVRVGGRLDCVSAARYHGLWVPEEPRLHLAVPRRASRLRTPDDRERRLRHDEDNTVVVHWSRSEPGGTRRATAIHDAIVQSFSCMGEKFGFVVLESALRRGRLDVIEHARLIDSLPASARTFATRASHVSDSGTESMVKLELLRLRLAFVQQALVFGVGPVDFLIGARLVVEIDSREHHSDPYRDRKKDAELSIRGYRVLRFMYAQIVYEWPTVEAAILAAIARGDHLAA